MALNTCFMILGRSAVSMHTKLLPAGSAFRNFSACQQCAE